MTVTVNSTHSWSPLTGKPPVRLTSCSLVVAEQPVAEQAVVVWEERDLAVVETPFAMPNGSFCLIQWQVVPYLFLYSVILA